VRVKLHIRWAGAIATLIFAMATIVATSLLHNFQKASHRLTEINEQAISKELMEQMQTQGRELSAQLGKRLANALYYYDLNNLQRTLTMVQGLHHVSRVYVFDSDGRILQDGRADIAQFSDVPLPSAPLKTVLNGKYLELNLPNQQSLFVQPIMIGDSVLGGVSLQLSFADTQQNISKMKRISRTKEKENLSHFSSVALAITLCLVFIGAAIATLVARQHTRPIHRLVKFAQAIGSKNYTGPTTIERNDELGDLACALNQMAANLEQRTQQIEHLAYHDSLTELPNRRKFTLLLDKAVEHASLSENRLATFCIDLDGFKRINDTLGHETGNQLLKAISQRIEQKISQSEYFSQRCTDKNEWVLARMDGDEFAIFLQNIPDTNEATFLAHCVMQALASTFFIDGHELMISASIGIATYPENGRDATRLLRCADIAMCRVKAEGKRDFKFFSEAMDATDNHKMSLESDLGTALSLNELDLHYQPIVDTQSGKIIGAEALVRWTSARHGNVGPSEFISIAEECGLIHDIGQWIIHTALTQLAKWNQSYNTEFQLSINISGLQLLKQDMANLLIKEIFELELNPTNIHLEVTETSLVFNKEASIKMLDSLKSLGIKIWLDDFGTGYSSLSHLKLFNVDGVKIDRSFVSDLEDNEEDRTLTFAIIAMAEALGLNIVAEGVETMAQWHLLSDRHRMYIQGYLISKALQCDEFEHLAFKQHNVYTLGKVDTVN
jgi:diguanylate cyclase (GGDEF)-like protein